MPSGWQQLMPKMMAMHRMRKTIVLSQEGSSKSS